MKDIFLKENIFKILDYIDEGIQIINNSGEIIYFNKFAQKLDDIDTDKAIGRHVLEIYPSLSYDTSTLLKVIKYGKPILNVEQTFVNYKGNKITTVNSSIPIKSKGKIMGALEISKDITDVKKLSERIVDLQKKLYKNDKKSKDKKQSTANYTFVDIVGQDEEMLKVKSLALKASQTSSPILVFGETGTGKELLVQSIHSASPRKNNPFISQNCAALPGSLLEGILFGTVRGGFTGAEDRPGLFELADGGTLFLDEINSMPLNLQAKFLRVLQDGIIRRVGSTNINHVDVRIITAINIEPKKAVEMKLIRNDLYYRLNVIGLRLPKLKDRKKDISILTNFFIKKFNNKLSKNVLRVSSDVMNVFLKHSWPGNVRELENTIEGIMSIYDISKINLEHLPYQFEQYIYNEGLKPEIKPFKESVESLEKSLLIEALEKSDYNITYAAKLIDLPRQTLQYKIKKYDLNK